MKNISQHFWLTLTDECRVNYDINDNDCYITFHTEDGIIGEIYCDLADARAHYKEMLTEGATI